VVGESVYNIQGDYAAFHHDVFDQQGNFEIAKWKAWDGPRDDLCGAVLTKSVFLSVILFLWTARMLGEFKTIKRLSDDLWQLPGAPYDTNTAHTILVKDDQFQVIALTCRTRFVIYLVVIVPKVCIAIMLTYIGCRWLTATMNFGDLILNALALEFVIGIDEQILEFFLPVRTATNVEATKFAYPSKGAPTKDQEMKSMQKDYFRNIFFFALTAGLTWAYLNCFQQVIPGFSFDVGEHCGRWFEYRFHPQCEAFEKGCFPFGHSTSQPHHYTGDVAYGE